MHGCQDVVRIWQDIAETVKMLVRGSTRVVSVKHCVKLVTQHEI